MKIKFIVFFFFNISFSTSSTKLEQSPEVNSNNKIQNANKSETHKLEWTNFPSIKIVQEKTYSQFNVSAKTDDPDNEIFYGFMSFFEDYIQINRTTGVIWVTNHLDVRVTTNITLTIRAYLSDFSDQITGEMLLLVEDVDDYYPNINCRENNITIPQNSETSIVGFTVSDNDLGINSEYKVTLTVPDKFKSAFNLTPTRGAGTTNFEIYVSTKELDFDDDMNPFNIEIQANGVVNYYFMDTVQVTFFLAKGNNGATDISVCTVWILSAIFFILTY